MGPRSSSKIDQSSFRRPVVAAHPSLMLNSAKRM
jgi:hypothetical protein